MANGWDSDMRNRSRGRIGGSILFVVLLIAPAAATPRYRAVRLDGIPHVKQRPDFCGEACAEMALKKLGSAIDQDDVFALGGIDAALGRGLHTRELAAALEKV